jgi:hypothetical protein
VRELRIIEAAAWILAVVLSSCITQPDENSGGDSERYTAKPLPVGKWDADQVDTAAGDKTDWKVIELQDTGFLTVEVVLDNPDCGLTVAIFDRYGKPVTRITHRKGDAPQLKLTTEVGLGRYFVQVFAEKESDKTGYSIRAIVR